MSQTIPQTENGPVTGKTLIALGFKQGAWFAEAISLCRALGLNAADEGAIRAALAPFTPPPTIPLRRYGERLPVMNIRAETPDEGQNIQDVEMHMKRLLQLPTAVAGAVMPDACVSGRAPGTIPVGGVIATENAIHPGMHSADICCSMAITVFGPGADPKAILDAGMKLSHFGGGGRAASALVAPPSEVIAQFEANAFLKPLVHAGVGHFATQGDGNHFFYVGKLGSTGQTALVTHHGSRKPGAMLYKSGMELAEKTRARLSPETGAHNAWIVADSKEGEAYWAALQIIRAWTKANHFAIHDLIVSALGLKRVDRFWNEHNFVFRKSDGLFYHAKGATPAWADFAPDSSGLTLIPLNMAEPVLIARGRNAANGLGFAPHGAGRNLSRSAYMRQQAGRPIADVIAEQTPGIDARFFWGIPDLSELPGAYKNADQVRRQIGEFGLADIVDTVEPYGSIMAGDWEQNAPWRKKRAAKAAAKAAEQE